MKLKDVMTQRVRTLAPDDSLAFARSLLLWAGIRHAPVVENGRLVGLLTDRDLAWYIARNQLTQLDSTDVSRAMRSEVITAGPEDSLTEAAGRMAEHRIGCLPITEKGALIGLVTVTDILAGEVREHMEPADEGVRIADVMTRNPIAIHPDDRLTDAAARMQQHRIRHLPVVDADHRAIGMLSDRDLRQAIGDFRRQERPPISLSELRARDAMSEPVVSVSPDASVAQAARYFADHQIGALAVVDDAERLVGIASYVDLLNGALASSR